jgi:hypothetical protein
MPEMIGFALLHHVLIYYFCQVNSGGGKLCFTIIVKHDSQRGARGRLPDHQTETRGTRA